MNQMMKMLKVKGVVMGVSLFHLLTFLPLNAQAQAPRKECGTIVAERIFGKPEAHKGRRMGVVLCYGKPTDDVNALRDKAKRLAETVLGTDPYAKLR